MSTKSIDSAPRSSINEDSSFTFSNSQPMASATVCATFGNTARISSLVIIVSFIVVLFHFESAIHVQDLPRDVLGVLGCQKPNGVRYFFRPAYPPQQNTRQHLVAGLFTHRAGKLRIN